MNSTDEESVNAFVKYTDKEMVDAKKYLDAQQKQREEQYQKDVQRLKELKESVPERQLQKFLPKDLFKFTDELSNRLDSELNQVISDFKNKHSKTQKQKEDEERYLKELEVEQRLLEQDSCASKPRCDEALRDSISQQQKVRKFMVDEVEIDQKQTAGKKILDKEDIITFELLQRGEIDSEISGIVFPDKDKDEYGSRPPKKTSLDSDFQNLDSDEESVFNCYWEEFEQREIKRRERSLQVLHDPMMLLEKLKSYSKNMYKNLSPDDKTQLMNQIERFLDDGVTPLQKYYDEMKTQFNMPSKNLLGYEKKEFRKQVQMIRRAHEKEIDQVKNMAAIKAREIISVVIDTANKTVKKEMTNIIKQFNQMGKDLYDREQRVIMRDTMVADQEKTIQDLKICLFQSCRQQQLEKEELDKLMRYLNAELPDRENNIRDLIKGFMNMDKSIDTLIEKEAYMQNPFGFYTSYIYTSLSDRRSILRGDVMNYYQSCIDELKRRVQFKEKEVEHSIEMNNDYMIQINQMSDKCEELKSIIGDLKKDLEHNKNRYEKTINDMATDFEKKKIQLKKESDSGIQVLMTELKIREIIQFEMQKTETELKDEIVSLKKILMVPRLHYKYMEKMNLDEWKKEYEKILNVDKEPEPSLKFPKSTKNTYRSLPRYKRFSNDNRIPQISDLKGGKFDVSNKNLKLKKLVAGSGHKNSPKRNSDFLPDILNTTTDAGTTTLQSVRYERSSPSIDINSIMNTSVMVHNLEKKRMRANYSNLNIMGQKFQYFC
ncbi:unnamed protein product [Moneuplotes crassus]|uniref:Uncharacterized protein n=1 Tax=Euplotes crassus TaxID=5936 RepID=A0AAD1YC03_EUPCR|nr:unnamed protein product [Moneuplotes crassus]